MSSGTNGLSGIPGLAPISFSGLVSGLDTTSIIQKLTSITKLGETPLQTEIANILGQNTSLNTISADIGGLNSALNQLILSSTFLAKQATSSSTSIFTASATSIAASGSYSINVQQLASGTSVSSQTGAAPVSSAYQGIGTAPNNAAPQTIANVLGRFVDPDIQLQFAGFPVAPTVGNFTLSHNGVNSLIVINPVTDSLNTVLGKINTAAGLGVTATLTGDKITLTASDANPIGVGAGSDTSNFLNATSLSNGTVAPGPNYSVTSALHLGAVNPNAVLTQASTVLADPGAAPVLGLAAGGSLVAGDNYEVQVVAFNSQGYLTQASAPSTIVAGAGNQTINVTYAPVAGASGNLIYVRDLTAGETTYQAIAADNSGSANISSHTADSRVDPSFNATGGSVANFFAGAGPAVTVPTAGAFTLNGTSITIKATDTLQDVLNNINNSGANVSAQYNSSLDTISVNNKKLGSSVITMNNGGTNFFGVTDLQSAVQNIGNQSKVAVNGGAPIFNTGNSVTNAVNGVTLSLLQTGVATLTVSNNSSPAGTAFGTLVVSMNKVENDLFNATTPPTFTNKNTQQSTQAGPLFGNFLVQNAQSYLENALISPLPNFTGPYQSLEDLGLSFTQAQGQANQFSMDSAQVDAAIAANPQAVSNLVTRLATHLQTMVNGLTDTATGFPSYVSSNNKQVDSLNQQIAQIETQANAQASLLSQQFNAMEAALSQFNSLGSFLTNEFNQLSSLTSSLYGGSSAGRSNSTGL